MFATWCSWNVSENQLVKLSTTLMYSNFPSCRHPTCSTKLMTISRSTGLIGSPRVVSASRSLTESARPSIWSSKTPKADSKSMWCNCSVRSLPVEPRTLLTARTNGSSSTVAWSHDWDISAGLSSSSSSGNGGWLATVPGLPPPGGAFWFCDESCTKQYLQRYYCA